MHSPQPRTPTNPNTHKTGSTSAASARVDDFAEFLADAYAPWMQACTEQGWVAHFVCGPAAHALVIYDLISGPVEVTDRGRPLPDSPADVEEWLLVSRVGVRPVHVEAPMRAWLAGVHVLMAASR